MIPNFRFICELGSTHMGDWETLKKAIIEFASVGVKEFKLQLFTEYNPVAQGNIYLRPAIYEKAVGYCEANNLKLGASVFDADSFSYLITTNPSFIKLAYSQRKNVNVIQFMNTQAQKYEKIVSCDFLTAHEVDAMFGKEQLKLGRIKKLYCVPRYPVYEELSFDEIFTRHDGFSDHTLGIRQTKKAVEAGATIIEKHCTLDPSLDCPDARFAITPKQVKELLEWPQKTSTSRS